MLIFIVMAPSTITAICTTLKWKLQTFSSLVWRWPKGQGQEIITCKFVMSSQRAFYGTCHVIAKSFLWNMSSQRVFYGTCHVIAKSFLWNIYWPTCRCLSLQNMPAIKLSLIFENKMVPGHDFNSSFPPNLFLLL